MRIVAIVAAYNEERFIGGCLEHLFGQGVEAYLIDNCSTDRTVEVAEHYLDRGLIGIETFPRPDGTLRWNAILQRKEEVAADIEADWFMHADPDEIRLPPRPGQTLAEAFTEVDAQGYNAVNFVEFTFIPTRESPEHDHPDFQRTMKWYYPFMYNFPWQIKAWKRQPEPVKLHPGGHRVAFPGLCLHPESFRMKHYQFLSLEQARTKYLENRQYDAAEIHKGFWRAWLVEENMQLPMQSEFNTYTSDDELSLSNPRVRHVIEDWAMPVADRKAPGLPRPSPRKRPVAGTSAELIVAGFHRSGTSLTAQLLGRSGLFLGYEMLARDRSNPHGHFEEREIVRFHDRILEDNGLSWQVDGSSLPVVGEDHERRIREIIARRKAEHRIWGFKDPRVCLFMDTWKSLLPEARFLVVYRSFAEATYSLHLRSAHELLAGRGRQDRHRRFWEEPDLALKMWLTHNKALIDFVRAHPDDVLVVSFDMLRKNFPLVEALNQRWGLGLEEVPTREVFDPEASAKMPRKQPVSDEKLIGETLETWEALERLGGETEELAGTSVGAGERLTEEVFYKPTDALTPLMENELLGFLQGIFKETQTQLEEATTRIGELERAEKDLQLIVKRASDSKLAPLFRFKKAFRELEGKYLK